MIYSSAWDRLGMALSGLCLIHCTVLPLALLVLPWLAATALAAEQVHAFLAAVLLGIGAIAFVPGYLQHRRGAVLVLGGLGVTLIATAAFGELPGDTGGETVTVLGSFALIAAHWTNRSACLLCASSYRLAGGGDHICGCPLEEQSSKHMGPDP